jgi:hypothetical protein
MPTVDELFAANVIGELWPDGHVLTAIATVSWR